MIGASTSDAPADVAGGGPAQRLALHAGGDQLHHLWRTLLGAKLPDVAALQRVVAGLLRTASADHIHETSGCGSSK